MRAPPDQRCSVLVVDDDAEVRELLRLALEAAGYRMAAAADGREALHYLRAHAQTCVILLDVMLPRMDGAAFLAALRRDRSLAWIPVLVISGAMDARERARRWRARGVLCKPLDLDAVVHALRRIRCAAHPARKTEPEPAD